jgi:hypothetical protein
VEQGVGDLDTSDQGGFEAADDLGGVYSPVTEGSSSGEEREGVSVGIGSSSCFQPVPARARELRLSRRGAQWVIPLA